jgi:ankyrin repeat protein
VVKVLAELGADINASNFDGSTQVLVAAYHGHVDVITYLYKRGADMKPNCQWSLLELAE